MFISYHTNTRILDYLQNRLKEYKYSLTYTENEILAGTHENDCI
jgi:hypothetical protein